MATRVGCRHATHRPAALPVGCWPPADVSGPAAAGGGGHEDHRDRLAKKHSVVYPGLVETLDAAGAAGCASREKDVDILVVAEGTYWPEHLVHQALRLCPAGHRRRHRAVGPPGRGAAGAGGPLPPGRAVLPGRHLIEAQANATCHPGLSEIRLSVTFVSLCATNPRNLEILSRFLRVIRAIRGHFFGFGRRSRRAPLWPAVAPLGLPGYRSSTTRPTQRAPSCRNWSWW